jgi:hypothetical protein
MTPTPQAVPVNCDIFSELLYNGISQGENGYQEQYQSCNMTEAESLIAHPRLPEWRAGCEPCCNQFRDAVGRNREKSGDVIKNTCSHGKIYRFKRNDIFEYGPSALRKVRLDP